VAFSRGSITRMPFEIKRSITAIRTCHGTNNRIDDTVIQQKCDPMMCRFGSGGILTNFASRQSSVPENKAANHDRLPNNDDNGPRSRHRQKSAQKICQQTSIRELQSMVDSHCNSDGHEPSRVLTRPRKS
jgi:hypothetical protein